MKNFKTQKPTPKPIANAASYAKDLHNHYYNQDNPPADDVVIPHHRITKVDASDCGGHNRTFRAIITYITFYIKKKVHTVEVQFQTSPASIVLADTLRYV